MITIDMSNVLAELRGSIDKHGGDSVLYKDRLDNLLLEAGMPEPTDPLVRLSDHFDCYYVTPEIPENIDDDSGYHVPDVVKPACLIGCLLVDRGVPTQVFYDEGINNNGIDSIRDSDRVGEYVEITPDAVIVLAIAQESQDAGKTWGEAYEDARNKHIELTEGASASG